jgi:hypothetical protein
METAKFWIEKLGLQKHPEGGWFKEIYRSEERIDFSGSSTQINGDRNCSTSIYFLLEGNNYSAFHRIKSDEIWHFYTGNSGVIIYWIEDEKIVSTKLGNKPSNFESFQVVVPKNLWFAAELENKNGFALVVRFLPASILPILSWQTKTCLPNFPH